MANYYQQPRIVVEQSPWETLFDKLPDTLLSFHQLKLQAEEKEKDRQFKESQLYLSDKLSTRRMLQKEVIASTKDARERGLTVNTALDAVFNRSPEAATNKVRKVSSDFNDMLSYDVDNLSEALIKTEKDIRLADLGARDAHAIDKDFNGILSQKEIQAYQDTSPEILNALDIEKLPEAYLVGAQNYLGKEKVRESRKALFDLNQMLAERVKDTDPDTPGLQWDPSDPRSADIQNALDMIQLQNIPQATAALKKIVKPKDPFAVEPYGKLSSRMLEEEGMIIKEDPYLGDIVKRIDPTTGDTLDVSTQEAAKIIMGKRDQYKVAQEMKAQVKLAEGIEDKRKEDFDAEQDQRYRSLRSFYESGPLYARKTASGKFPEKTPKWVKKIYDESNILYSLLSKKAFPGVGGKHESEDEMKLIQKDIQSYITELMTKSGYRPDSDLKSVFKAGKTVDQKARNVLKSPKFQAAVDPDGDGNIDTKEASKNLNELFDLHGREILGLDEASLAQGEAIAHLYNIWFGLESELDERRRNEMDRIDAQRKFDQIYSGQ